MVQPTERQYHCQHLPLSSDGNRSYCFPFPFSVLEFRIFWLHEAIRGYAAPLSGERAFHTGHHTFVIFIIFTFQSSGMQLKVPACSCMLYVYIHFMVVLWRRGSALGLSLICVFLTFLLRFLSISFGENRLWLSHSFGFPFVRAWDPRVLGSGDFYALCHDVLAWLTLSFHLLPWEWEWCFFMPCHDITYHLIPSRPFRSVLVSASFAIPSDLLHPSFPPFV